MEQRILFRVGIRYRHDSEIEYISVACPIDTDLKSFLYLKEFKFYEVDSLERVGLVYL